MSGQIPLALFLYMNYFNEKIKLNRSDRNISDSEHQLINDLCKPIFREAVPIDALDKVYSDLYYSLYHFSANEISFIIKVSIHKNIFKYEKSITRYMKKNKKTNIFNTFIKSKKIKDDLEIALFAYPKIVFSKDIPHADIKSFSNLILSSINYGQTSLNEYNYNLDTQDNFLLDFFTLPKFINNFPSNKLDKDIINSFCKDALNYFNVNVCSKIKKRKDFCLGLISKSDIAFTQKSGLPMFMNIKNPYRGNKVLDYIFCSSLNDLDILKTPDDILKRENISINQLNSLKDHGWIISLVYAFFNQLILESYFSLNQTSQMQNCLIYIDNKNRFKINKEFEKYLSFFDNFFIDKYK